MKAGRRPNSPWSRPVDKRGPMPSRPICPYCEMLVDDYTGSDGYASPSPKPEDVGVCLYCGQIVIYTAELTLRKPDEIEAVMLPLDPAIRKAMLARSMFIAERPHYRREIKR